MLAVVAGVVVAAVIVRTAVGPHRPTLPGPGGERVPTADDPPDARGTRDDPAARPLFTDATRQVGLRFEHVCGATGEFHLPEEMGPGGAFLDYDGDSDLDIYLVQGGIIGDQSGRHRNRLFRNDGTGHFEDVSEGSGADVPGYGMGCTAADYDNDGDVDIFVTRLGPNVLLRNNGDGTFSDVTEACGVGDAGFGTAAAFLDYDRDGFLDLYVANYVEWSAARAPTCYNASGARDYCTPVEFPPAGDRLYRNTGRTGSSIRFEDVTEAAGVAADRGNGLGVLCSDFDADGWVDIYVANDQTPAFLWVNQRDGTFREDAALSGCAYNGDGLAIAGMGVVAEDLDDDGDDDLLVTNITGQAHLALRNDGGLFEDATYAWGLGGWGVPYTGFGVALFDADHDGILEAFVANGAVNSRSEPLRPGRPLVEPNQFLRRNAEGRFHDASSVAGLPAAPLEVSRGAMAGDYDNDGDLDLLITNNRGPVQLLRNNQASPGRWTLLDVIPAGGGRHALNARVELVAGGHTFRREVRPHVSYLGTNDPRVHLGLGAAKRIERLMVRWPDGNRERWEALPVDRCLILREGSAPAFEALPPGDQTRGEP